MFEPEETEEDDDSFAESSYPRPSPPDEIQFLGPVVAEPWSPPVCSTCRGPLNSDFDCVACRDSGMQFGDLQVDEQYQANPFGRPANQAVHRPYDEARGHAGSTPSYSGSLYPTAPYSNRPYSANSGTVGSAIGLFLTLLATIAFLFLDPGNIYLEIFVSILDGLIVLAWVLYHRDLIFPLMKLPDNPFWLLAGLAAGVVTFILTSLFLSFLANIFGAPVFRMTDSYFDAGFGIVTVLLLIVVQPMIVEEFAFRGVIFKVFERVVTLREAILISSCMFAALHLSPFATPHTFLIGILAVVMLHRSGSIWPGVLLHGMHNFLVIAEELWF